MPQRTQIVARFAFMNAAPHPSRVMYRDYVQLARRRGFSTAILPFFVSHRAIGQGGQDVRGSAVAFFYLDFSRSLGWKTVGSGPRRTKRFCGGVVEAACVTAIFLDERMRFKRRAIASALDHELGHAAAYRAKIRGRALQQLARNQLIAQDIIAQTPVPFATWEASYGSSVNEPMQQMAARILSTARTANSRTRLLSPPPSDQLAAKRWIDNYLWSTVVMQLLNAANRSFHALPEHTRSAVELGLLMQMGDDADLVREQFGQLPPNVA